MDIEAYCSGGWLIIGFLIAVVTWLLNWRFFAAAVHNRSSSLLKVAKIYKR
jgi:hypothetical protein